MLGDSPWLHSLEERRRDFHYRSRLYASFPYLMDLPLRGS